MPSNVHQTIKALHGARPTRERRPPSRDVKAVTAGERRVRIRRPFRSKTSRRCARERDLHDLPQPRRARLWDANTKRAITAASPHGVRSPESEMAAKKTRPELCQTCHRDKVASSIGRGICPCREQMQCSTCHNTHGSTNVPHAAQGRFADRAVHRAPARTISLGTREPGRLHHCHDPRLVNERMLVASRRLVPAVSRLERATSTIYDQALVGAGSAPGARDGAIMRDLSPRFSSNHPSGQRFIR